MLIAVLSCQCHGPSWAGVSCVTPTTRNWPCACSRLEMSWMAIHNSKGILNQGLRKGLSSLLKLTPGVCTILRASLVFPFSMLNDTALQPSHDVFMRVAREIFSDGKFNWGRVVALFYFACRLVIKALLTKVPDIIRTIISWATDYLRDHVINWIRDQGGWEGIRSYFGTPTWQTVGVFLAGVLTTVLVIRKM
uniref:BCL2 associated X, apoptosis regulator a n=1 Tax=Oncorhynchus mykiss TaxID=8022 RepID=A0A8C7Q268_ONCMY